VESSNFRGSSLPAEPSYIHTTMASRILAFCLFLWRATATEHCSGAGCAFDAELTGSSVVLLQQQKQARHSANAARTQNGNLLGLSGIHASTSQAMPENCVGQSTKEDETRPIKEVLAEHGNPDGFCYFKNNPFYINPVAEQDFRKKGQMGVDGLRNWALTCKQPFREGSGSPVTWTGDWGDVSTDNLDCTFYNQDLIYCYTFGWLRNQHLDSSLITNNTAWIELAGKECDDMQNKFQFADEEVTIARMKHENEETGRLGLGAMCSQKKGCQNPITSRELAMHVYPKCLLSLEHGAASEMAYCQQLGCVLPDDQKGAKKIGTGSQCEPL